MQVREARGPVAPDQAAALLHEAIERWETLGYENMSEITNATLIGARIRDWSTTLAIAPRAIRHLHCCGWRIPTG